MQDLPGFNVLVHCAPLIPNPDEAASPMIITLIFELFELMFLIVTFLDLLVLPAVVLSPKFTVFGVIDKIPTGVGVAVGVVVAVGVAVAVAVCAVVAVAVGVEVAVALGLSVAVAVAV